jgi:hypothetical protein
MEALKALGGVEGLAKALHTDVVAGLDPAGQALASIDEHLKVYGANRYKERPTKNFFALCWENLQDPIILLLIAAALVGAAGGAGAIGAFASHRVASVHLHAAAPPRGRAPHNAWKLVCMQHALCRAALGLAAAARGVRRPPACVRTAVVATQCSLHPPSTCPQHLPPGSQLQARRPQQHVATASPGMGPKRVVVLGAGC